MTTTTAHIDYLHHAAALLALPLRGDDIATLAELTGALADESRHALLAQRAAQRVADIIETAKGRRVAPVLPSGD